MGALYNEYEPFAADWLRNLVTAGHIAAGAVDARSITDLRAADVRGVRQAHFFAGIGVWSHALRLAGWPDDREVWTGSCPCQPFSVAGRGKGIEDERHLWPEWFRLIRECRPSVVFGEQVASPAGLAWLDAVSADLEGEGYAFAAADLCAAGVGAPHIRQRLYFVAYDSEQGREPRRREPEARDGRGAARVEPGRLRIAGVALGDTASSRREGQSDERGDGGEEHEAAERAGGHVAGFWSGADWIPCLDGKARPVEPGPLKMADGLPKEWDECVPEPSKNSRRS